MHVVPAEVKSPAERAGLLERDTIIGYDDQTIASIDDLHRLLTENAVGVKTSDLIKKLAVIR